MEIGVWYEKEDGDRMDSLAAMVGNGWAVEARPGKVDNGKVREFTTSELFMMAIDGEEMKQPFLLYKRIAVSPENTLFVFDERLENNHGN